MKLRIARKIQKNPSGYRFHTLAAADRRLKYAISMAYLISRLAYSEASSFSRERIEGGNG